MIIVLIGGEKRGGKRRDEGTRPSSRKTRASMLRSRILHLELFAGNWYRVQTDIRGEKLRGREKEKPREKRGDVHGRYIEKKNDRVEERDLHGASSPQTALAYRNVSSGEGRNT